jgi:hypothetical protein
MKTRKRVNAGVGEVIREVFVSPLDFYTPAEAAAILGWTAGKMERAIEEGGIAVERGRSGGRIAWQEVAAMLTARCPQAAIEEALGREIGSVMPELVRLAELRIRIPRYQGLMLAMLAERERISVDELMARHFLDLAACESDWLGRSIPGFDAAMRWPGGS